MSPPVCTRPDARQLVRLGGYKDSRPTPPTPIWRLSSLTFDDRCECAQLGYVLNGKVKVAFADGSEEVYEAGEAYNALPGHTPTLYAGTEIVDFSPPSRCSRRSRS